MPTVAMQQRVERLLRNFRNRCFPLATKQKGLAIINPALKRMLSRRLVEDGLARLLDRYRIEYLDLGGWMPVEGYLTLHLSPVEPYGLPVTPRTTMRQRFDDQTRLPGLEPRTLEAAAISLNFNVLSGMPLLDESMRGINLSHFLEHFDLETGRRILRECWRVLRPDGVVRVSCPDLRRYAAAYIGGDSVFFQRVGSPAFCAYPSLPTCGAIVAGKAYDASNQHKWFYDAETAIALLRDSGFTRAGERKLHESSLPRIADIEPGYREIESFYVEAQR